MRSYQDRIEHFVYNLRYNGEFTALVKVWIHQDAQIQWDENIEAPAQISMETRQVTVNPRLVAEMARETLDKHSYDEFEPFMNGDSDEVWVVVKSTVMFLLLHEIAHHLYSPTVEMMIAAFAACVAPQALSAFASNITEDSTIQVLMQREHPGKIYGRYWQFGQLYYQGDLDAYAAQLNDPAILMAGGDALVYTMLYYFILRAYNERDPRVIRKFDSPILPWKDDTIAMFDMAERTIDTGARLKATVKFAELVYRDLKDAFPQGVPRQGQGNSDQPHQNGGGGDRKPQPVDGEGGGGDYQAQHPGTGTTSANQNNSPNTDQGESEQKDQEGESKSKESEQSNQGQQQQQQQQQNQQQKKDQPNKEASRGNNQDLQETLDKALKKLNEQLHASNQPDPTRTAAEQKAMQKRAQSKSAAIGAQATGIRHRDLSNDHANLPKRAYALYEDCSTQWQKIFNQSDYTIHGLDEGDVDPLLVTEWYTEKNYQIFCRDVQVRQGKDIQVIFILDHSGSMGYSEYDGDCRLGACAQALTAMCHAFEDAKIKSTIFDFANDTCLIKTADETPEFVNGGSNVFDSLINSKTGGGTDPSGAFEALVDDPMFQNDDEKIVFFLTDGYMGSTRIEDRIQAAIDALVARGHWYFVAIGIDFDASDLERLSRFTKPGTVKSYTTEELSSKLGEDIFNLITEEFIKA